MNGIRGIERIEQGCPSGGDGREDQRDVGHAMRKLILINGNGGVGKKTNSQILYSKLPNSAWVHMRWILALKAWGPTPRFEDLGLRNAAAIINNYFDEDVQRVIYSGNVYSQELLDRFLELVSFECEVNYFWLDADKSTQRARMLGRGRDSGDKLPDVDWLLTNYRLNEPPSLVVPGGNYFVIDTNSKHPEQIVEEMIAHLKISRLEDKDLFVP